MIYTIIDGKRYDTHIVDGHAEFYEAIVEAQDTDGKPYKSKRPHCTSCESDMLDGYSDEYLFPDTACCCVHATPKPTTEGE